MNRKIRKSLSLLLCLIMIFSLTQNATSIMAVEDRNTEVTEEIVNQQEYKDAIFKIAFKDMIPKDVNDIIEIYSGEEKINDLQIISEEQEPQDDLKVYQYTIKNLPVYNDDLTSKNKYVVKLKDKTSYQMINDSSFDHELSLIEDNNNYVSKEIIGVYLSTYDVEGTIQWENNDHPSIEEYFKNNFKVLLNNVEYDAKIEYQEKDDVWKYKITNLYVIDNDNKDASYTINNNVEGYNVDQQRVVIKEDHNSLSFKYTKIEAKEATEQVKKPKSKISKTIDKNTETQTVEYNQQTSMKLHWQDATQVTHENPDFILKDENSSITMKLTYNKAEDKYTVSYEFGDNTPEEIKETFSSVKEPSVELTGQNTLNQTATINNLVSQIDNTHFNWQISEINADGYIPQIKDNNTAILTHMIDFEADVVIKNGDKDLSKEELNSLIDGLVLSVNIGNQPITGSLEEIGGAISDIYSNAKISYEYNYEDNKLVIHGLPGFSNDINSNKQELVYSLIHNEPQEKEEDYYAVIYDNKNVSNFSSVTNQCHNGGKITLIRKGTTQYEGTKVWLDEGKSTRPSTKWTLWRYSLKEEASFKTASPVYNSAGQKIEWNNIEDIDKSFTYTQENLPKYDNDGYEYVYFVKETMTDTDSGKVEEYVKHFGTANEDFTDDVLPPVIKKEEQSKTNQGDTSSTTGEELKRADDDTSLYNGGTLTNRHEKKVNKTVEKKWIAAEYQSSISDVEVKLTLQCRAIGEIEWKAAKDDKREDIVKIMKGFKTESMSMEESVTVESYNMYGQKLEYRWVETAVDGKVLENDRFTLSTNNSGDCESDKEQFQVITETVDDKTTITNQLVGNTCYQVKKIWHTENIPESIDITLEQRSTDGSLVGTYTYTMRQGENDSEKEWNMHITEYPKGVVNAAGESVSGALPKYDENGAKYTYYVTEKSIGEWHANYEYEVPEQHYGINNVVITNDPVGEGKLIKVRKVWLDDGDAQTRGDVTVAVYRKKVDTETNDKYLGQVTLKASKNWWDYFDVTEYVHDGEIIDKDKKVAEDQIYNDGEYYIKEVSIKDSMNSDVYKVENNTVTTNKHKYEVSYPQIGNTHYEEGYYTVVNRRVGHVNLSITKQWIDGNKDKETRKNYNARIVLQKNGVDTNQAIILTGEKEEQEIRFENLDKYDEQGHFIHYSIVEYSGNKNDNTTLEDADYITSINYDDYTVEQDSATSHDLQTIKVENKESKTKDVVFYKKWIDQAVFDAGNRPDIYLELYYVDSKHSTPTPLYKDHIWKFNEETSDTEDNIYTKLDGDYYWSCKFSNLPKYDDQGKEIIYYAREGLLSASKDLDYIGVQYTYKEESTIKTYANISYENGEYIVTNVPKENDNNVLDTENNGTVLREGGTFVNQLKAPVTISGKKIWENIPEGYPSSQLPEISFKLYQDKGNTQSENPIAHIDSVSSESTDFRFAFKYINANSINGESLNELNQVDTGTNAWEKLLPKYDPETGEIYTYRVEETITLNNTMTDNLDLITDDINNNYQIKNTYDTSNKNRSSITVEKKWVEYTGDKKPETQYTLYRFFKNKDNTYSSPQAIETKYLASNGKSLTFENLLIYAPNGNKFIYYVVEGDVNGYTTASTLNVSNNDNIENVTINGEVPNTTVLVDQMFTLKYKQTNIVENIISLFTATNPDITFTNTYNNVGSTSINVQKNWYDIQGLNNRPTNVYLALYREAKKQSEHTDGDNSISELVGIIKLDSSENNTQFYKVGQVINKAGTISCSHSAEWQATIDSLDNYAPNGNKWTYTIKEVNFDNFDSLISSDNQFIGEVTDNNKIPCYNPSYSKDLLTITNNLETISITATKEWKDINNQIQKPTVVFRLQVRESTTDQSNNSWLWASCYFKDKCGNDEWENPTNDFVKNLKNSLGELDKNLDGIKVNYDTNYEATFKNLPKYANGKLLEYRVMEVKIGNIDIKFDKTTLEYKTEGTNLHGITISGIEDPYITIENGSDNTISNTLKKATSLTIQKVWNDQDNAYNTRGGTDFTHWEVKYKIYRQVGNSTPEIVKNSEGTDYIVSINQDSTKKTTAGIDTYSLTIDNLPLYNLNGQKYSYFAKELTKDDEPNKYNEIDYPNVTQTTVYTNNDGQKFTSSEKYNGGYDVDYVNTTNNNTYTTKVTNTLETTNLLVTKKWNDNNNQYGIRSSVKLTLQRKVDNGDYADVKIYTIEGNKVNSNDITTTLNDSWEYTFSSLPKYDSNGDEYIYTVKEDNVSGYFTMISDTEKNDTGSLQNLTVTNEPTEISFKKIDKNDNDIVLEGAEFKLTPENGSKFARTTELGDGVTYQEDTNSIIWTSTTNLLILKGILIVGNTYILSETKAPDGYEKSNIQFQFKINENGQVVLLDNESLETYDNVISLNEDNTLIAFKDTPIDISFKKINTDGTKTLAGAIFKLTPETGSGFAKTEDLGEGVTYQNGSITWTSTNDPLTLSGVLIAGNTYTLEETIAPDGYEKSNIQFQFKISESGQVVLLNNESLETYNNVISLDNNNTLIQFKDTPIDISFKKTNSDGSKTLAGAIFKLTPETGSGFAKTEDLGEGVNYQNGSITWTSTNNPLTLSGVLIAGNIYILEETEAPDGYEKSNIHFQFKISESGQIELFDNVSLETYDNVISLDNNNTLIQFKDTPIDISFKKINTDGTKTLAGAIFKLTPETGSGFASEEGLNADGSLTLTSVDGILTLSEKLIAGNSYTLTETKAPDGYVLDDQGITFTVNDNGTITFTKENSMINGDGTDSITVKNRKTLFYINKIGSETNERLSGVELKIYAKDDWDSEKNVPKNGANAKVSWTTNENAKAIEGLKVGDYVLYEAIAPYGYKENIITFTLSEDNSITNTNSIAIDEDTGVYTINMVDTYVRAHFKFTKVLESVNKTPLSNIVFDLYKGDNKIAGGLTTDNNGCFTSVDSEIVRTDNHEKLKQGLEVGTYYLRETSTTNGVALDSSTKWEFKVTKGNHYSQDKDLILVNKGEITNKQFTSTIQFNKIDSTSKEGISDAIFKLYYSNQPITNDNYKELIENVEEPFVFTSDENGFVSMTVSQKGYYLLEESTNVGYKDFYTGIFEITDEHYNQTLSLNDLNPLSIKNQVNTDNKITNDRVLGTVELRKVDGDSQDPLNDVGFKLMKQQAPSSFIEAFNNLISTGHTYKYVKIGEIIDTNELTNIGVLKIKDLEWGTYKLIEVNPKDGYSIKVDGKVVESEEFTIDRNHLDVSLKVDEHDFYNYKNSISIHKSDSLTKEELSNAQFEVLDENGKSLESPIKVTIVNGTVDITGQLVGGKTYILHEALAPAGYEVADDIKFTMNKDGTITINDKVQNTNDINVYDESIEIVINKTDGNQLITSSNAKFTLYQGEGDSKQVIKNDLVTSNSTIKLNKEVLSEPLLINTIYTLEETEAPKGYEIADAITFKIDKDGNIYDITNATSNSDTINVSDNKITLKLKKVGPNNSAIINKDSNTTDDTKAIFNITGTFADNLSNEVTKQFTIDTVNSDNEIMINDIHELDGKLIAGNSYTLTETKAPDGYELADSITFTVNTDGSVYIEGKEDSDKISVQDTPIQITLIKEDLLNNKLSGGVFELKENDKVLQKLTTTDEGIVINGLIQGHEYELQEIKAPNGYELASSITFTVNNDGSLTIGNNNVGDKIIVKDNPIQVKIKKTDLNNKPLNEAIFKLTDKQLNKVVYDEIKVTNDNGEVLIPEGLLIQGHEYVLEEIKAPDGYELADSITFTVNTDGSVYIEGKEDSDKISVQDTPIQITLIKEDLLNNKLSGGVFELKENDKVLQTLTTTDEGIVINGLIQGHEYELQEIKAPDGYVLDTNSIKFKVNDDGTVTVSDTDKITITNKPIEITVTKKDWGTDGKNLEALSNVKLTLKELADDPYIETVVTDNEGKATFKAAKLIQGHKYEIYEDDYDGYQVDTTKPILTFTVNNDGTISRDDGIKNTDIINKRKSGIIEITKIDSDHNDKLLDGAEFTLYDLRGKEVTQSFDGTSVSEGEVKKAVTVNGKATISDVLWGTYILKETKAPKGYKLNTTEWTIHIGRYDNKVSVTSYQQIKNQKNKISIQKVDGTTTLSGAEFKLTALDNSQFASYDVSHLTDFKAEIKNNVLSWTSLESKAFELEGYLVAGGKYKLEETKAPDGYILKDTSVEFTVESDGTVSFDETDDIKGNGTSFITVNNTKTYLELSKIDNETGNKLSKAVLEIYKASEFIDGKPAGKAVASWTSHDINGRIEGLVSETDYVLYENQTVSGYDSFEPVYFRLNKDNTITINSKDRDDLIFDSRTNTITMKDTRIRGHIQISKKADGNVENVKFDLYRKDGTKIAAALTTDINGNWTSKDNQTDKFTDIDGKEVPFSQGLTTGEYYLIETQATSDTVLNNSRHEFTIGDSDSGAHGTVIDVDIENQAFTSDVKVIKLDETSGKGISGVSFVLSYTEEHQNDIKTVKGVTDENGEWIFKDLPKGEYTIKEEATTGYDGSTLFEGMFVIDESDNGSTIEVKEGSQVEKTKGSWSQDGILNRRVPGSVTLYKMDESQGLNDVEFVLMKKNDEGFFDKIMNVITGNEYKYTDSINGKKLETEGQLTINDLEWGTYKLVEVKAKDGYSTTDVDKALETVEFTIDREREKEVKLNTDGNRFYNHKTSLTIRKTGKDGEALNGAEFELTGKMADIKETSRTVKMKEGTLKLEGILIGGETYTLKETKAPEGYEVNKEVLRFRMEKDGKVEVIEEAKGYELTTSTFFDNQLEVTDEKIAIIVEKIDGETKEKLTGARFEVTPKEGSYFTGHEEKIILDGEDLINGLTGKVIAGHSYILKEIKAPDGYVLLDESIVIKISNNGLVEAVNDHINVDQDTIQVKNLPTEVSFVKRMTDNENVNIEGAELSITGRFADREENTITWTTTKQPQVFKNVFIAGEQYVLKELKAPAGAMFDTNNQIMFTVSEQGQIIYDTDDMSYQDGQVIVWNEPTVVSIRKLDSGNNRNLTGARLQVLDSNKNIVDEWISTNKEHIITGKLDANKEYILHEVSAPTGYLTAMDVSFKVNPIGLTEVTMSDPRMPEGQTLPNLIIYKVSQDEQFLIGASFRLVKVENDQEIEIGVQSGGPRFEFTRLEDGIYRIYEVNAPDGYRGLEGYFEIEIVNRNIYYDGILEHSFTVYNTNDGTEPYVLGDEIDDDDYQEWVLGEEAKSKVKTSDNQNILGYSSLSVITILLLYLLKKKKFNQ